LQKSGWGEHASAPRRGKWTEEEIGRLEELYGLRDEQSIARELGRTVASVRRMASDVFSGSPRSGPWTDAEVERLKRYIGVAKTSVIGRILRRTQADVDRKLVELSKQVRSGPWSPAEMLDLKRLYGTRTDEDLARILARSVDSVQAVARRLCLAKDKAFLRRVRGAEQATAMPRWGKEELALLQRLYPTNSNLEIAQRLDRSVKSVVSKAHHMGLKKNPTRLREMGRENVKLRYDRTAE
jgi:hypothetical protein